VTDVGQRAKRFPCPVCAEPRNVRFAKNDKPYIVCDPCGVQLFVRGKGGIQRFAQLLDRAGQGDLLARYGEMERRYHPTCPACGKQFWVTRDLIETSWFDGGVKGARCPAKECGAVISSEHIL
jgi:transcription elongation factor Elf1